MESESKFFHPGDVHHPIEFGFNLNDPADRESWERTTGEVLAVADYSQQEAELIQELVRRGHTREVAVQTVLYDRLV